MKKLKLLGIFVFIALLTAEVSYAQARRANTKKATTKTATAKTPAKKKTVGDLLKGYRDLQKKQAVIPRATVAPSKGTPVSMAKVAPIKSQSLFQGENENEAELEKLLDAEIDQLFKLSNRYKKSPNRGELWLRLAELYVEKARLYTFRAQTQLDKDIAAWEAKDRKGPAPKADLKVARSFNLKAIQLYEYFLTDFPRDKKVDQALFFLGYNYVEMGDMKKGVSYYERLTKQFPNSPYVSESHFALGEFYFDNRDWKKAQVNYQKVLNKQTARLYGFALYKLAWCYYRQGRVDAAIKTMEQVVNHSRKQIEVSKSEGLKSINRIRLASEALKDLVPFYADIRDYREAKSYFLDLAGEKALFPLLERLAYVYSDAGKQEASRSIFKELLSMRPTAPKAFDYQYQIVQNYSSRGSREIYKQELLGWISEYGPESEWARANSNDSELLKRAYELRESTLRNYVLLQHQTAQNTRSAALQRNAREGYELYIRTFQKSDKLAEMYFFYGELLYDMKSYDEAASRYNWVVENSNKDNKYYEQAVLNSVLAAEKNLPTEESVRAKIGDSLEPVAYGQAEQKFIAAAERYLKIYPKGDKVPDIRFKMGRIAYSYNNFDEALRIFEDIVAKYPKTQYATFSANLILDIYNLRKDYEGLAKAGTKLLNSPDFNSVGAAADIKNAVERATFKKAQDLEVAKDYKESALQYDEFAKKYPQSSLVSSAKYNAAINYERAGMIVPAIAGYKAVVDNRDRKNGPSADVRKRSQRLLARLYEQTGQYEKAAVEFERYAKDYPKDQYEEESYYNAAILWDGLQMYTRAVNNYEKYFEKSRKAERKDALFLIANVQEKRGSLSSAAQWYQKYIDSSPASGDKVIASYYKIGVISKKLGRPTKMKEAFEKTISVQRRLSGGKGLGASEAAEAKFELAQPLLKELESIRIPINPANQKNAIDRKFDLVSKLNKEMVEVIKYDDGNFVIAALTTTGRAYEHMSRSLYTAPKPKGLTDEEMKIYDGEIEKIAGPLKQSAIDSYKRAVDKGFEIQVYNKWLTEAQTAMNRYDATKYIDYGDKEVEVRDLDLAGL